MAIMALSLSGAHPNSLCPLPQVTHFNHGLNFLLSKKVSAGKGEKNNQDFPKAILWFQQVSWRGWVHVFLYSESPFTDQETGSQLAFLHHSQFRRKTQVAQILCMHQKYPTGENCWMDEYVTTHSIFAILQLLYQRTLPIEPSAVLVETHSPFEPIVQVNWLRKLLCFLILQNPGLVHIDFIHFCSVTISYFTWDHKGGVSHPGNAHWNIPLLIKDCVIFITTFCVGKGG